MSERRSAFLTCALILLGCVIGLEWLQLSNFGPGGLISKGIIKSLDSGPSWLESRAYLWLGALFSLQTPSRAEDPADDSANWYTKLHNSHNDSKIVNEIPGYVLEYAPFVHLNSKENFWPCDMAEHLFHITPNLNYTPIQSQSYVLSLKNLNKLNMWDGGRFVYLKSDDNVEERPDWLSGQKNIPNTPGEQHPQEYGPKNTLGKEAFPYTGSEFKNAVIRLSSQPREEGILHSKMQKENLERMNGPFQIREKDSRKASGEVVTDATTNNVKIQKGGRSDAPAVLIVVDKGEGIVDAFWFFFYSYNLGNLVFNIRFGNHVGDWEHTLVRFVHGEPKYVFFSEHNFGSAYSYMAVEKIGKRPVAYSAIGTHAMYATSGFQPYILPFGILHDQTDRGPLWDPLLNAHMYTYDHLSDSLYASNITPQAPIGWFYFAGRWGDKFYPLNDKRQYRFLGQYHYVTGPLGPRFKNLGRKKVCQGRYTDPCVIKNWLTPTTIKYWDGAGNGEKLEKYHDDMKF